MSATIQRTRWSALVSVRVPRNGGPAIRSNATRRLQRLQSIEAIEIDGLVGIEPTLSATVARFDIEVVASAPKDRTSMQELLESASGIESVEQLEPVR